MTAELKIRTGKPDYVIHEDECSYAKTWERRRLVYLALRRTQKTIHKGKQNWE